MKKVWDFLNGKKTVIGTTIWVLAKGAMLFVPNLHGSEQLAFAATVGELIATGGLIHKGIKTDTVQKSINKAKTLIKK